MPTLFHSGYSASAAPVTHVLSLCFESNLTGVPGASVLLWRWRLGGGQANKARVPRSRSETRREWDFGSEHPGQ